MTSPPLIQAIAVGVSSVFLPTNFLAIVSAQRVALSVTICCSPEHEATFSSTCFLRVFFAAIAASRL